MGAILWSILTIVSFLQICHCSGVVEFRLDRYSTTCTELWGDKCDIIFTFCFDKPKRTLNFYACAYKRTGFSSDYANQNDITFGSSIRGLPNPSVIAIPSFVDPRIMVGIRVYDKDDWDDDDFVEEIQLTLTLTPAANSSTAKFVTSAKYYRHSYIQYAYRAYCNSNYYGVACDVTCIARNDSKGHYSCSDKGQKVCYTGWEDENCTTDINECTTTPHICNSNQACINTPGFFHCECAAGWDGDNCMTDINECRTIPHICSNNTTDTVSNFVCINTPGTFHCECATGWEGDNCVTDINECRTIPDICNNSTSETTSNFVCINTPGSYNCQCATGWEGYNCVTDINECITKPGICNNSTSETTSNFVCINTPGSFHCECATGWEGDNCVTDINECTTTPDICNKSIVSNFVCIDTPGLFDCECAKGWKGDNCTTDINECTITPDICNKSSNDTISNVVCINTPGSFHCKCATGWEGDNCATDVNECTSPYICSNSNNNTASNVVCINTPGLFYCECATGWEGINCTTDINECTTTPDICNKSNNDTVGNVVCINTPGSFHCECAAGWERDSCNTDINECITKPGICNNGTKETASNIVCINTPGSFDCECAIGWEGDNCTTDINECTTPDICKNSTNEITGNFVCINTPGSFHCECEIGWEGDNCMTDINECTTTTQSICSNIANNTASKVTCINTPGSYHCECTTGWDGDNCTSDVDECLSAHETVCFNGGYCKNTAGSYTCECPSNWTGQNCSEDVDECVISSNGSSLCQEVNTECQNTLGGFICTCAKGWTGDSCTGDVDECSEAINGCQNGAKCMNTVGDFYCDCESGWTGKSCSECVTETGCKGKLIADDNATQNEENNLISWPVIVVTAICFIAIVVSVIIVLNRRRQRRKQETTLDHLPPATELQGWSSDTVTFPNRLYDVMPTHKSTSTLNPKECVPSQNSDNNADTYQDDKVIYHEGYNENNNLVPTETTEQILQNATTNSGVADFNVYDHMGSVVPPAKEKPYSNFEDLRSASANTQPPVDQRGYAHLLCQAFSSKRGLKTENNHSGLKRTKAQKQLDQEFQLLNYGFENEDGQCEFILSELESNQYMEAHLLSTKFSGATEAMLEGKQIQAADEDLKTDFDDSDNGNSDDNSSPEGVDQPGLFQGLCGVRGYQHLSSEDTLEQTNAREQVDETEVKEYSTKFGYDHLEKPGRNQKKTNDAESDPSSRDVCESIALPTIDLKVPTHPLEG